MGAPERTSRRAWIDQGLRSLADGGPSAIRIEAISGLLGVSKGGFYNQFADRDEYLREVLDAWESEAIDEAIEGTGQGDQPDVRTRIRRAGVATFSVDLLRDVDLAIRDWARNDDQVAARLRRVDNRRMSFLRQQFGELYPDSVEVEARSLLAFCLAFAPYLLRVDFLVQPPEVVRGAAMDIVTN